MALIRRVCAATAVVTLLLLTSGAPIAGVAEPVPELVTPWPSGLAGTLVFESDVAGRPGLYTLDLARGVVARLTGRPATPSRPRDGHRTDGAWCSRRTARTTPAPPLSTGTADSDVWSIAADGSDARRLTREPSNDQDPAWTSDGARVVFSSDRDSRGDLFELRLDTGATTRLTRHFVGRAIMPAPSPGAERVAFAAQSMRAGAFWAYPDPRARRAGPDAGPGVDGGRLLAALVARRHRAGARVQRL